jgi:pilus assembly protein CpaF
MVVTGATGAGKTTVLGALVDTLDPGLRVLVVEDATELTPRHPQVVRLQARPPNVEGVGEVAVRDLVRQALRMRPDRLVLGEVRGPEVVDLLVALNTGHEGGLSTVHANRPGDVPARLEALGALAGLPRDAVHSLVGAALHAVVHCRRDGDRRVVGEIAVLEPLDGRVVAVPALVVDGDAVRRGPGLARLAALVAARGTPPP